MSSKQTIATTDTIYSMTIWKYWEQKMWILTISFSFNGCTHSIWKFPGQGLNLSCSCDLCCSCSQAGSFNLQHWAGDWAHTPVTTQDAAVRFLTHCAMYGNSLIISLTTNWQSQENSWVDPINATPGFIPSANSKRNWVGKTSNLCSDSFQKFSAYAWEDRALAREHVLSYWGRRRPRLGEKVVSSGIRDISLSSLAHTGPMVKSILQDTSYWLPESVHETKRLPSWAESANFPTWMSCWCSHGVHASHPSVRSAQGEGAGLHSKLQSECKAVAGSPPVRAVMTSCRRGYPSLGLRVPVLNKWGQASSC